MAETTEMLKFARLKTIASKLLSNLIGTELDLLVYQSVLASLKDTGVAIPDMGTLLANARERDSPAYALVVRKYAQTLIGLRQFGENDQDKAWLDLLKSWMPAGPAN